MERLSSMGRSVVNGSFDRRKAGFHEVEVGTRVAKSQTGEMGFASFACCDFDFVVL